MPMRDWKCMKCGHLEEIIFHKESEVEFPRYCPHCRKLPDWKRMPPMVAPGKVKNGTPKYHQEK